MKTLVWLHGDSLSSQDPASRRYPSAERVFVFDRPFLEKARLSFKRIFFLYECAAESAHEIRVGQTVEELQEAMKVRGAERLAVTESVSPRWREFIAELRQTMEVEVIPAEGLVRVPEEVILKRFTPFWRAYGREWGG